MPRTVASGRKTANSAPDKPIVKYRSFDRWFEPVIDELRPLFPHKFAVHLAAKAGVEPRIAQLWMSGRSQPGGAALACLLCSDVGDRVHLALTRGVPHAWRRNLGRQIQIIDLKRETREAARRLAALEEGIL